MTLPEALAAATVRLERRLLLRALRQARGYLGPAAEALGVSKRHLERRIAAHGLAADLAGIRTRAGWSRGTPGATARWAEPAEAP